MEDALSGRFGGEDDGDDGFAFSCSLAFPILNGKSFGNPRGIHSQPTFCSLIGPAIPRYDDKRLISELFPELSGFSLYFFYLFFFLLA